MERALPMNEEENLLWEKWKESGVSEQQRSHLLIQHRLEERKKKEYECNRKNDENQQRRADMQFLQRRKKGFGGSGQGRVLQEEIEGNS